MLNGIGYGARMIHDIGQRALRGGLPVYLRVAKFDDSGAAYTRLGLTYVPSPPAASGFDDILIAPPPEVSDVGLHNIGLNQSRLNFGARNFNISHTWVAAMMAANGYSDPYDVFRSARVVGLYYESRLYSIESITNQAFGGEVIYWHIVANAQEKAVTVSGS